MINSQKLGDFGEIISGLTLPDTIKTLRSQTFLTTSKEFSSSNSKRSMILSSRDLERKITGGSIKSIKSIKDVDETKKGLMKQNGADLDVGDMNEEREFSRRASIEAAAGPKVNKMKLVYDAVKALKIMQRFAPKVKKAGDNATSLKTLTDIEKREGAGSTVATLNLLDEGEAEVEDDEEKKEFEAYVENFGKITQYLGEGESFGEKALKKSGQKNATSILCRTPCEFLTLGKRQFDDVFGQIEKEREEFLNSVFPTLSSLSSANFQFLVCCFKTERFSKGHYIIKEGQREKKKAKFYVIQSGECLLEKRVLREVNNPYNLKRSLISGYDNIQISVAGKGAIIGEEILDPKDEYEYSVKVISKLLESFLTFILTGNIRHSDSTSNIKKRLQIQISN